MQHFYVERNRESKARESKANLRSQPDSDRGRSPEGVKRTRSLQFSYE